MPKHLQINPSENKTSPTNGIQEAIDNLKETGGVLHLSAGTYKIARSINVYANITISGDGNQTIIKRPSVRYFKPTKDIIADQNQIILESTFEVTIGSEICIKSEQERGWHSYHGVVKNIDQQTVTLEPLRVKEGLTYKLSDETIVSNWFPAFCLQDANLAQIKNLQINGDFKNPDNLEKTDFTNAAIHTINASEILIDSVTIKNWPGDGIGVQKGAFNTVTNCLVDNCCGQGMHPGTGTRNSSWTNNISKNNTQDGFYFCLHVYQCLCSNNQFIGNKRHGIGGLTRPDRFNIVANNIIDKNGRHGVEATNSWHNIIEGNMISNNSQKVPGECYGLYLKDHEGTIIKNNRFFDDQEPPTQHKAIHEENKGTNNIVADNLDLKGSH